MKYSINEISIEDLLSIIENESINLKPSYQRNFIWGPKDQTMLIDSILIGFPLPNFFVFEKPDKLMEMVDGQQRARTIFRFWKGIISSSDKKTINDINQDDFLNYKLNWVIIKDLNRNDSLEQFYVLVNKRGKHLNTPELFKADYHHTKFLALVEDLLDLQELINLDLFSDAATKRMNDRSFVEELVAYLKFNITDKKEIVERIYKIDIDEEEYKNLKSHFINIISIINDFNKYFPINKTRFKQRNDFYTLFNFVCQNLNENKDILLYWYKILLLVAPGVSPSNDDYPALREYALNCVSQSNSKKARTKRLEFFNHILKNTNIKDNIELNQVLDYLQEYYNVAKLSLLQKGEYNILDIEPLKERIQNV